MLTTIETLPVIDGPQGSCGVCDIPEALRGKAKMLHTAPFTHGLNKSITSTTVYTQGMSHVGQVVSTPGKGWGGHSCTEGAAPSLRISRKKGSFFKTFPCPRFCKRRVLFCTQVRSMGVKIPLQSTKYTRL